MPFASPFLHHPITSNSNRIHPFFFKRINPIKQKSNQTKSNPHPSPHVVPCFFAKKYHLREGKINLGVKSVKTETKDIPKETNKTINITETNESNDDLKLKLRTIDDWGDSLLLKT